MHSAGFSTWELADSLESLGYILCSIKMAIRLRIEKALLKEAGNFAYIANVLAKPLQKSNVSLEDFS